MSEKIGTILKFIEKIEKIEKYADMGKSRDYFIQTETTYTKETQEVMLPVSHRNFPGI